MKPGESGEHPGLGQVYATLLKTLPAFPMILPLLLHLLIVNCKFASRVFQLLGSSVQAKEDTDASTLAVAELYCSCNESQLSDGRHNAYTITLQQNRIALVNGDDLQRRMFSSY